MTTTSTGRSQATSAARTDRRSTGSPIGQRVGGRPCAILITRPFVVDPPAYARDSRRKPHRLACVPSSALRQPRSDVRRQRERAARRRPVSKNRRRPTLPGPCEPSTIGAEGLNCSVRNGKRCFPLAVATGKRRETEDGDERMPPLGPSKLHSATAGITPLYGDQKNPSSPRPISTGLLRTLPSFQIRPINLVVYQGSYSL